MPTTTQRLAAVVLLSLVLVAPCAQAHAYAGALDARAPRPSSPPGEGADAERIVQRLAGAERDPDAWRIVGAPIDEARRALERAHGARASGDRAHGRMLDRLALEWANVAEALSRAVAREKNAVTTASAAREAGVATERARALLEETQARRGRVAAELAKADADAAEASTNAARVEAERVSGARRPTDGADSKREAKRGSRKAAPPAKGNKK